jgi:alpha-D-xyloside xylohydrolase
MNILNKPPDISEDFFAFDNTYYLADELVDFDPETGSGKVRYLRYSYTTFLAFNSMDRNLVPAEPNEFPPGEYEVSPVLPFSIDFVSSRTIRIRMASGQSTPLRNEDGSLMLAGEPSRGRHEWVYTRQGSSHEYRSAHGSVLIHDRPWRVEFFDGDGKLLSSTNHASDNTSTFTSVMPFAWVRRVSDYSRSFAAVFNMHPDERIFGFGEQYTAFNKRGQKLHLYTDDARGSQNDKSHKPVPFFLSSRGYGMFIHTSAPITCDVGRYFSGVNSLFAGDDELDMFIFIGQPKEVLDEYTDLTGKSPLPPLWSFGFWMSRITYYTEAEGREVAARLREHEIPCDVIHYDSGWFERDILCDFEFSTSAFADPGGLIADLREEGFRVSLWQLPYFVPKNKLFPEIIEKGLFIRNGKGALPYEDAILDFTNPEAVSWYQAKLARLLEMGVSAIKADFGEAAPLHGLYHNGRSGYHEHNLYPNRYNKAVADVTRAVTGEHIIWARSGWAGSQRYPVHWGGDACTTGSGMAGALRGGLSIGLSGFSFWSHDIGGFVERTPEHLYRRWLPFGVLSSHARSHGQPPKEPWGYSEAFVEAFRDALNLRYRLMPYIYAQARHASEHGLPMVRALFVEYPDDPGAWLVDDQYLFGSDILVAPLFEETTARDVYLPGNHAWIDYQTGRSYRHGWNRIEAGAIPVIMLVRDGALIPHIEPALSTAFMDWSHLELKAFRKKRDRLRGMVFLPDEQVLHTLEVETLNGQYRLTDNPCERHVRFSVS